MIFIGREDKETLRHLCDNCIELTNTTTSYRGYCNKFKEYVDDMPVCKVVKYVIEDRV